MFCQGLTVIIDDIGGHLPLNPTKEQIAFGEEDRGEIHKDNLFRLPGEAQMIDRILQAFAACRWLISLFAQV